MENREHKPEITFEQTYHSRLKTDYSVEYVLGDIQLSGRVTEDAGGNQSFAPSWFLDEESETYWDNNWESIETEIINFINN